MLQAKKANLKVKASKLTYKAEIVNEQLLKQLKKKSLVQKDLNLQPFVY